MSAVQGATITATIGTGCEQPNAINATPIVCNSSIRSQINVLLSSLGCTFVCAQVERNAT